MKIIFLGCLIIIINLFSSLVAAGDDGGLFFSIDDPSGDDFGPGTYRYPTNKAFQGEGLFDINRFSIKEEGDLYIFRFSFQNLTDPWKSKYGFSLPLIQLYIDNTEGGSVELFREGANVRLDAKAPWDRLLTISGWWVRLYHPEDRNKDDDFWTAQQNPWDVEEASVQVEANTIRLALKKDLIGPLKGASLFLLVGGFDPFGPDYYRNISQEAPYWNFQDQSNNDLKYAPRVIDLILPGPRKQQTVLARYSEDYPLVYPFTIKASPLLVAFNLYFLFGVIILLGLVYLMHKNFYQKNTRQ